MPSILADGSRNRLSFVNGVWFDKTLSLKAYFKKVMDTVHQAAWNQVDFQNKATEVLNQVNLWAEKQTNGLIKKILPPDSVNKLTRVIFANAVYFKGAWSQKFDKSKTKESDFQLVDGNKVQAPFINSTNDQFVMEFVDFKVLGLPYLQGKDKRQFTMYIFLPDAKHGLHSLVEKIGSTSDFIDCHIPSQKVEVGKFLMPKFKISFGLEVSKMLKELALVLPFKISGGGLTEMVDSSDGESIYASCIYHKSFVEVNE